jgi:hypothetical protein
VVAQDLFMCGVLILWDRTIERGKQKTISCKCVVGAKIKLSEDGFRNSDERVKVKPAV